MEFPASSRHGEDRASASDWKRHYRQAFVSQPSLPYYQGKPSLTTGYRPFTPYCGLKLAELAQKLFPPGVVQSLSGDDSLGPWLTSHPGIDKISFTGSTATGKAVLQSASKTLKRVTLEL